MLEEKIPYSLEQVKEIANDLEFGYIVFVNIKTGQWHLCCPKSTWMM